MKEISTILGKEAKSEKTDVSMYIWVCIGSISRKDYRLYLSGQTKMLCQMLF